MARTPCNMRVSYSPTHLPYEKVFRLEISVNNGECVKVFQGRDYLCRIELGGGGVELARLSEHPNKVICLFR